jgi:hypothetical protein
VLGFVGILRDRQAAALLDALDADRAVAVGAREDDRRRVRAVRVGEGAEEQVDGDARPRSGESRCRSGAVRRRQRLAGRDDVDVVGLDATRLVRPAAPASTSSAG